MARRKQPVIPDQLLDQLLAGTDAKMAFEKHSLLDELKKALAERVLNAEMDDAWELSLLVPVSSYQIAIYYQLGTA